MPSKLEPAFIFDQESFDSLRDNINDLAKDIEEVYNDVKELFELSTNDENIKYILNIFEIDSLKEFFDRVCNIQHKLQEDIWLNDDEEDEKRNFAQS